MPPPLLWGQQWMDVIRSRPLRDPLTTSRLEQTPSGTTRLQEPVLYEQHCPHDDWQQGNTHRRFAYPPSTHGGPHTQCTKSWPPPLARWGPMSAGRLLCVRCTVSISAGRLPAPAPSSPGAPSASVPHSLPGPALGGSFSSVPRSLDVGKFR